MKTLKEIWLASEMAMVNGHAWNIEPSVGLRCAHLYRFVKVNQRFARGFINKTHRIIKIERPLDMLAEAVAKS